MAFNKESDFEEALITILSNKGWEKEVLHHPTEQDLIDNWAKILYENSAQGQRAERELRALAAASVVARAP